MRKRLRTTPPPPSRAPPSDTSLGAFRRIPAPLTIRILSFLDDRSLARGLISISRRIFGKRGSGRAGEANFQENSVVFEPEFGLAETE
eukprot:1393693-Amorphochlora_amoeboformis.AAC.2